VDADQVVVHHNTRVNLRLPPHWKPDDALQPGAAFDRSLVLAYGALLQERCERVVAMAEFLATLGFRISTGKDGIVADSSDVEAGDAKRKLIGAGFQDREFQIVLEYTRKWGML
jgi:hypothetical protein